MKLGQINTMERDYEADVLGVRPSSNYVTGSINAVSVGLSGLELEVDQLDNV